MRPDPFLPRPNTVNVGLTCPHGTEILSGWLVIDLICECDGCMDAFLTRSGNEYRAEQALIHGGHGC